MTFSRSWRNKNIVLLFSVYVVHSECVSHVCRTQDTTNFFLAFQYDIGIWGAVRSMNPSLAQRELLQRWFFVISYHTLPGPFGLHVSCMPRF